MAKGPFNLASMGVEALIKLRDDVGTMLSQKTSELKKQLQRLEGGGFAERRGRGPAKGRSLLKGGKLPPKYRDSEDPSQVWAGRGARPRWMEERIKAGAKQEDFLIAGAETAKMSRKKTTAKRRGRKKKAA
jgi:DNA-binding protein H-NS